MQTIIDFSRWHGRFVVSDGEKCIFLSRFHEQSIHEISIGKQINLPDISKKGYLVIQNYFLNSQEIDYTVTTELVTLE